MLTMKLARSWVDSYDSRCCWYAQVWGLNNTIFRYVPKGEGRGRQGWARVGEVSKGKMGVGASLSSTPIPVSYTHCSPTFHRSTASHEGTNSDPATIPSNSASDPPPPRLPVPPGLVLSRVRVRSRIRIWALGNIPADASYKPGYREGSEKRGGQHCHPNLERCRRDFLLLASGILLHLLRLLGYTMLKMLHLKPTGPDRDWISWSGVIPSQPLS